jgi:hypothetical protein
MPIESGTERYPDSVAAVRAFFAQYYGSDIAVSVDDAEQIVRFSVGPARKPIAFTFEFLAAFDAPQIRENLAAWNIAHLSRTLERGCRLLVTSEGTEEERA